MDQTKKLTGMLLAIGVLFLVCELPRVIMAVIFKYLPKTYTPRILMNLTFVISGINHSCNFFIYVISGQRFRQVLSEMFGCLQGPSDLSRSTPSLATQVSQTSEPNQIITLENFRATQSKASHGLKGKTIRGVPRIFGEGGGAEIRQRS